MTVSPTVIILSVTIGVPLLLLALGVLYHAWVLGRQQPTDLDELGAHVEALATESTDSLLIDLREAVEQMQGQLARQRESLAGLLSAEARSAAVPASAPLAPMPAAPVGPTFEAAMPAAELRMAAGSQVTSGRGAVASGGARSLAGQVADLVAEGLSDRAIARQLHIGLEEVRIARMRAGR